MPSSRLHQYIRLQPFLDQADDPAIVYVSFKAACAARIFLAARPNCTLRAEIICSACVRSLMSTVMLIKPMIFVRPLFVDQLLE